jgi:hypothetical protein
MIIWIYWEESLDWLFGAVDISLWRWGEVKDTSQILG